MTPTIQQYRRDQTLYERLGDLLAARRNGALDFSFNKGAFNRIHPDYQQMMAEAIRAEKDLAPGTPFLRSKGGLQSLEDAVGTNPLRLANAFRTYFSDEREATQKKNDAYARMAAYAMEAAAPNADLPSPGRRKRELLSLQRLAVVENYVWERGLSAVAEEEGLTRHEVRRRFDTLRRSATPSPDHDEEVLIARIYRAGEERIGLPEGTADCIGERIAITAEARGEPFPPPPYTRF